MLTPISMVSYSHVRDTSSIRPCEAFCQVIRDRETNRLWLAALRSQFRAQTYCKELPLPQGKLTVFRFETSSEILIVIEIDVQRRPQSA